MLVMKSECHNCGDEVIKVRFDNGMEVHLDTEPLDNLAHYQVVGPNEIKQMDSVVYRAHAVTCQAQEVARRALGTGSAGFRDSDLDEHRESHKESENMDAGGFRTTYDPEGLDDA